MPIVGFNFSSINAYIVEKKTEGGINVNSTPIVENIRKKELNMPGVKDVLSIEFRFVTKYEPKIGEINISGEVLYQTDNAKNILNMWKEKKLDTRITIDVVNTIFKKCLTKAVGIADELRLPPPLNFPALQVAPIQPAKKGTGTAA